MPMRRTLHRGSPWVTPCASTSECVKYAFFAWPVQRVAWVGSSLIPRSRSLRSPMRLRPRRFQGHTGGLTIYHGWSTILILVSPHSASRHSLTARDHQVFAGLQTVADDNPRLHPVVSCRSVRQQAHSVPYSISEHASAHEVSSTSPWPFPVRSDRVNHPGDGRPLRWHRHLAVLCSDHATHQNR